MLKGHTPAKDKKYILYIHTCPNNKKYIGITSKENPNERWKNGKAYRTNKHFTSAILKYGLNNIKHEIVYSNLTKDEASEEYNVTRQNIYACCSRRRKSACGFIWRYKNG